MSWEPIIAILFMLAIGGVYLWLNLESKRAHDRIERKRRKQKQGQ